MHHFATTLIQSQQLQWQMPPAEWFATTIERFGLWQRDGAYGQRMLTKLINDCRAMQTSSSHELIRELLERIRHEPDSASPELKTNANAVQIMTVHAAKGLEFTAVFVPDAHAFDVRPGKQITFQSGVLVDPESEEIAQKDEYQKLERQKYNEVVALWYVALTRAKRFLMVSAAGKEKDSLFRGMSESLKESPIEGVDMTPVEMAFSVDTTPAPAHSTSPQTPPQRIASKQIIALSPSGLHELTQCPKRYRFQRRSGLDDLLEVEEQSITPHWIDTPTGHYTLPSHLDAWQGLAQEPMEVPILDDPQAAGKSARAIGSLFHLATELHAHHPRANAQHLCQLAVQRHGKSVNPETEQLLIAMVLTYLGSPLGQQPPQIHEVEQRIRWRIETPRALVEMTGVVDRQWNGMIVDYKTDESMDGIIERHGDQLRLYAQAWMRQQQQTTIPAIAVYHARTGTLIPIPNDDLLMRQTQQRVAMAATHLVAGDYPARPEYHYCRHCPARAICAEGRTLVPPQDIPAFEPFGW
jgi:ATP-dependent exoDNAse (exonuclease V) beta subunit